MRVQVCGTDTHRVGTVDLGTKFEVDFFWIDASCWFPVVMEITVFIHETRDFVFRSDRSPAIINTLAREREVRALTRKFVLAAAVTAVSMLGSMLLMTHDPDATLKQVDLVGRLLMPLALRLQESLAGRATLDPQWTASGADLYLQFFPPSLQTMESPAELMLQQMARAGVDRAVLQNARPYGRLNEYFAGAVRKYPDKFIGLADVDEANAHTLLEIDKLRNAVNELGLRGLLHVA